MKRRSFQRRLTARPGQAALRQALQFEFVQLLQHALWLSPNCREHQTKGQSEEKNGREEQYDPLQDRYPSRDLKFRPSIKLIPAVAAAVCGLSSNVEGSAQCRPLSARQWQAALASRIPETRARKRLPPSLRPQQIAATHSHS